MLACKSRLLPPGALESLRWRARRCWMPIRSSNSFRNAWKPAGVTRSYPAAKLWHVSMQIPMRWWNSFGIKARRSRNSEREPPIVEPWPHIVSRTGTTVDVAESALVKDFASRASALGNGVLFALPGLFSGLDSGWYK